MASILEQNLLLLHPSELSLPASCLSMTRASVVHCLIFLCNASLYMYIHIHVHIYSICTCDISFSSWMGLDTPTTQSTQWVHVSTVYTLLWMCSLFPSFQVFIPTQVPHTDWLYIHWWQWQDTQREYWKIFSLFTKVYCRLSSPSLITIQLLVVLNILGL